MARNEFQRECSSSASCSSQPDTDDDKMIAMVLSEEYAKSDGAVARRLSNLAPIPTTKKKPRADEGTYEFVCLCEQASMLKQYLSLLRKPIALYRFQPEVVNWLVMKALVGWFMQVMLLKLSLLSQCNGEAPLLDVVACGGVAFMDISLTVIGRLLWGPAYYIFLPDMPIYVSFLSGDDEEGTLCRG